MSAPGEDGGQPLTGHMEVAAWGEEGVPVVLLASLGRGAADFEDLGQRLARAGFLAIAPNPRGVAGTTGSFDGTDLFDLAADVAFVVNAARSGAVHIVGHQFGGLVARALAHGRPDLVRSVTLLGCASLDGAPEAVLASAASAIPDGDAGARLAVGPANLFAGGNESSAWSGGWWPATAAGQATALVATTDAALALGGSAPLAIIQGLEDRVTPPAAGYALFEARDRKARVLDVPGAGYALLPEQPKFVAETLVEFLRTLP